MRVDVPGLPLMGLSPGAGGLSETRKGPECTVRPVRRPALDRTIVLTFLNLLQLILYIPLLALVGQGALFVLAGPKRDSNFFYKLLQLLSKPFTSVVRLATPRQVGDHQVPIVTFFLVVILYFVVTFEKIDLCMRLGLENCR